MHSDFHRSVGFSANSRNEIMFIILLTRMMKELKQKNVGEQRKKPKKKTKKNNQIQNEWQWKQPTKRKINRNISIDYVIAWIRANDLFQFWPIVHITDEVNKFDETQILSFSWFFFALLSVCTFFFFHILENEKQKKNGYADSNHNQLI